MPRSVARTPRRVSVPRVTIVIAVQNGEDFVEEAVLSVLGQTYQALRLLVVDDRSTDGTHAILQGLARVDKRVELMANAGEPGLAGALACAFAAVTTEYIARLDADDLAASDRIERQIAYLDDHPGVGVLGSASPSSTKTVTTGCGPFQLPRLQCVGGLFSPTRFCIPP